jgi:neuropeptide Y receptor
MCCLAVPFTPISAYGNTWHLGRILCHLVPMSLGISGKHLVTIYSIFELSILVYVSTLTSLAIAVDRYFVIVHPFRSRMRLGVCILLIIVIWVVGISISLPLAIYMRFDHAKCEVRKKKKNKSEDWFFSFIGILATIYISTFF